MTELILRRVCNEGLRTMGQVLRMLRSQARMNAEEQENQKNIKKGVILRLADKNVQ